MKRKESVTNELEERKTKYEFYKSLAENLLEKIMLKEKQSNG